MKFHSLPLIVILLASSATSLNASSTLVRYPISSANGVQKLDGEAQKHITVSPLSPSKQLGTSASRGILGNTRGDYLISAWPDGESRNKGKFLEFKITAQSGFEVEYDKIAFTLYSLKDKKTSESLGPRFWELRASIDIGGVWSDNKGGSIFTADGTEDNSTQLAFIDMNDHSGSVAEIEVDQLDSLLGRVITGKTTSFRLYGYGAQGGQGGLYNVWNRGSDLLIHGTLHSVDQCNVESWGSLAKAPVISPIPESKHVCLWFSGIAFLLVLFRSRRG